MKKTVCLIGRPNVGKSTIFKIILNLCIPAAIGLCILADDCVLLLFGFDYVSVIPSLRILCISLITIALSNFTGYQILVSLGKEQIVLYSTIIGAIINLFFNVLLIPPMGHLGAAISAVITEAIIAMYQLYYVKKYTQINVRTKDLIYIILPSLFMVFPILVFKYLIKNTFLEISVSFISGVIVYSYVAFKLKNEFLLMVINKMKNIKIY